MLSSKRFWTALIGAITAASLACTGQETWAQAGQQIIAAVFALVVSYGLRDPGTPAKPAAARGRSAAATLTILALVLIVGALCVTAYADPGQSPNPRSFGYQVVANGVRATYILDKHDYGVAIGAPMWNGASYGFPQVHCDALGIFKPSDDTQLAAGFAVGCDFQPVKNTGLTISPLVGILTDITVGAYGRQTLPFVGLSVKLSLE
jgi:hypothetical protein